MPRLDFSLGARLTLYVAIFLIGLSVVFPGVWLSGEVPWVLRIPMALSTAAVAALLKIHKTVDHGPLEEAGVGRIVYGGSRLPLYLLVGIAVLLIAAGVGEIFFGRAR